MAQLLSTPALPTSVPKAKQFGMYVVGVAAFGLAVALGLGLLQVGKPYVARVPVVGRLLQSGPAQSEGLFAGLGG